MALSAVFACEHVEEITQPDQEQNIVEKVAMTFSAVIESDKTKTALVEGEENGVKKVVWYPGDAIAVSPYVTRTAEYPGEYWHDGRFITPISKFTSTLTSAAVESEFDGKVEYEARYKAFYPYSETVTDTSNVIYFDIPDVQKYVNGSFDPQAAPMVATANYGEIFDFQNLCGILAFKLIGSESIQSITFSACDYYGSPIALAGRYRVDPSSSEPASADYRIVPIKDYKYSVTLKADDPVLLDPVTPTMFYLMLPPGTYNSFTLLITTEDEKLMIRNGKNPITLERAHLKPTGALEYAETVEIDLSERGNANCYVVDKAGIYSFEANVIGNGTYGFVEGVDFHTSSPNIEPVKADLVWQDQSGLISDVKLVEGGRVRFIASDKKGNALIAVKDDCGTIIWSWHIWMTDMAQNKLNDYDQVYVNSTGQYAMMDRNLGATIKNRPAGDDELKYARGLLYQWGRKDPLAYSQEGRQLYETINSRVPFKEAIENPNVFYGQGFHQWNSTDNTYLWTVDQKTIYDPCPVGYRVPPTKVWRAFTSNEETQIWGDMDRWNFTGNYTNGVDFYYDNSGNTTYYPPVYGINNDGYSDYYSTYQTRLWSAEYNDRNYANALYLYFYSYVSSEINSYQQNDRTNALAVRCMKDDGFVDQSSAKVELVDISDRTSTSAKVVAAVTDEGSSPVTERGILWGTTPELTLETSEYYAIGSGLGEYSYNFTGLTSATRYYVRAYAVNARGVAYSAVLAFNSIFDGEAMNLSSEGTSNCYIVPPVYAEYSFDASVKGNSTESVGDIATVDVLWETAMSINSLKVGEIISDIRLEGNQVYFTLPFDAKPGNALIAVKDIYGTILWSWHIWVVDFDPEETKHTLTNGVEMMDRNLGALNVIPGNNQSHGLTYQWGRKDPFMGALEHGQFATTAPANAIVISPVNGENDNLQYSIQNPTVVVDNCEWNRSTSLWDSKKTMYDPCPAGWRVPDSNVWENQLRDQSYGSYDYIILRETQSLYPSTGFIDCGNISYLYHIGYYWTLDCQYAETHAGWEYIQMGYYGAVDLQMSVRCMKAKTHPANGNTNDYIVDDYEW